MTRRNKSETREHRSGPNLRHRMDAVARSLRGDDPDEIARDVSVTVKHVELWTKEFCRAGEMRLRQLPENWIERCLSSVEKLVPLATLISVLLAVALFIKAQHKEAEENARAAVQDHELRVRGAYSALDDRYLDYLKLCLQYPDLDVFDTPLAHPQPQTLEQQRRESILFSALLSILERAYLMYHNPGDEFERHQWRAWDTYMTAWSARANLQREWANSRTEFDSDFTAYMDGLVRAHPTTSAPATSPQ